MLHSVSMVPQNFFVFVILNIFLKIFDFFKAINFFFVIKYQFSQHMIDIQMLFQKNCKSPAFVGQARIKVKH